MTAIVNPGPRRNRQDDSVSLTISVILTAEGKRQVQLGPIGSFSAANLPPGLTIGSLSGRIRGRISRTASTSTPYHCTVTFTEGTHMFTTKFDRAVTR